MKSERFLCTEIVNVAHWNAVFFLFSTNKSLIFLQICRKSHNFNLHKILEKAVKLFDHFLHSLEWFFQLKHHRLSLRMKDCFTWSISIVRKFYRNFFPFDAVDASNQVDWIKWYKTTTSVPHDVQCLSVPFKYQFLLSHAAYAFFSHQNNTQKLSSLGLGVLCVYIEYDCLTLRLPLLFLMLGFVCLHTRTWYTSIEVLPNEKSKSVFVRALSPHHKQFIGFDRLVM